MLTLNSTLTLKQFIELYNSESELWDICYIDDDENLKVRPEITIE